MSNVTKRNSPANGFFKWMRIRSAINVDWQRRLRASGLPAEVQDIISRIAKRSRLLKHEKAEVVDDLIAHFEDGNRCGRSFDELINDFGDPDDTAKLIRTSKMRNRPMLLKFGRVSAMLGLGVVATYIIALILFNLGKPDPSTDYMAQFNEQAESVPDDQKAWLVYRDVWAEFGFCDGQKGKFEEIYHRDPEDESAIRLVRPGDAGWDAAVQKLQDSKKLLTSFHEGAKLPKLGVAFQSDPAKYSRADRAALFPDDDPDAKIVFNASDFPQTEKLFEGSMFSVLLPNIQSFRKAALILTVDSRWAVQQDDRQRVTQNIETIMAHARQVSEPEFLVCAMVGFAVANMGYDLIGETLAEDPDYFTEQQLERIQAAIEATNTDEMISFKGERLLILDIIQRVYTDDGQGDGRITSQGLDLLAAYQGRVVIPGDEKDTSIFAELLEFKAFAGPMSFVNRASRKEVVEKLDEYMSKVDAQFEIPFWQSDETWEVEEQIASEAERFPVLARLMPIYESNYNARGRMNMNRDGMLAAIAAHRYRLSTGSWPTSMNQLVGEFLEQIPVDQMTGNPLNIRSDDSGLKIYSVGVDEDDDQGRRVLVDQYGAWSFESNVDGAKKREDLRPMPASDYSLVFSKHGPDGVNGDWVIWPRYSDN